jgi:hypothetical protein
MAVRLILGLSDAREPLPVVRGHQPPLYRGFTIGESAPVGFTARSSAALIGHERLLLADLARNPRGSRYNPALRAEK